MRASILTAIALLVFAHVGLGNVVRQRIVPTEACGAASVAPGARLVLPTFVLKVVPLPAWAKGTFRGNVEWKIENGESEGGAEGGASAPGKTGTASLTVGTTGKVSGKLRLGAAKTATFSFSSYSAQGEGSFTAKRTVTVVQGRKKCTFSLELAVSCADDATGADGATGTATLTLVGKGGAPARTFGWNRAAADLERR